MLIDREIFTIFLKDPLIKDQIRNQKTPPRIRSGRSIQGQPLAATPCPGLLFFRGGVLPKITQDWGTKRTVRETVIQDKISADKNPPAYHICKSGDFDVCGGKLR